MGRAVDPRLTLRLSPAEHARLDAAALALGVETGGLAKAAALAGLEAVVVAVRSGELRLRGRSGQGRSAVSSAVPRPERAVGRADVVRAGRVVGEVVVDLDAAGCPVPETARPVPSGELRAAAFRAALGRRL